MAQTHKRTRKFSEEEELESAYRSISGSKGKKRNAATYILATLITLLAIGISVIAGYLYFLNAEMGNIIMENVYVAGVHVGGLSQADAIAAVNKVYQKEYLQTPMVVQVLDTQVEIPAAHFGVLDVKGVVKAASDFGQTGSSARKQQEQKIAMESPFYVDLTPYLTIDEAAIKQVLSQLGEKYNTTLSQSTCQIVGKMPDQVLQIQMGTPEYGLDLNKLYTQILNNYSKKIFLTEGECGMVDPEPIDITEIYQQYYKSPVDAYYDKENRIIVDSVNGYDFDLDQAKTLLENAEHGALIELPFRTILPGITAETIEDMLYRDTIGVYTAIHTSDKNRDVNLYLAAKSINDVIIYPGEIFSYNNALGERTTAKGYKEGPSYSGDKTVMTVGGGICQVSSALYYCALQGEMEILERKNHGFMPAYMPVGLDATVSWGTIDFRFKNTSDYPIKIVASSNGGSVDVKILGTDLRDYRVTLESKTISETKYETTYKTMPANNPEGYKDGDYIVEPYVGYEAETYIIKKSKDGTQLSRELIDKSTYRKRDAVICKIDVVTTE